MTTRRPFAAGVLVGLAAAGPLALVAAVVVDEMGPGLSIECRGLLTTGGPCRFSTGDRKTTPRLVARARWRWHVARRRRGRCRP